MEIESLGDCTAHEKRLPPAIHGLMGNPQQSVFKWEMYDFPARHVWLAEGRVNYWI